MQIELIHAQGGNIHSSIPAVDAFDTAPLRIAAKGSALPAAASLEIRCDRPVADQDAGCGFIVQAGQVCRALIKLASARNSIVHTAPSA
jgi:hypothetical protein